MNSHTRETYEAPSLPGVSPTSGWQRGLFIGSNMTFWMILSSLAVILFSEVVPKIVLTGSKK